MIRLRIVIIAGILATFTFGCAQYTQTAQTSTDTAQVAETSVTPANIYDSEDAAVVVKKDTDAGTIQLQNISTSKRYTLNYSGTTSIYNRYGNAISMQQLKEGSVVTVRFYKSTKSLSYIEENSDAFCLSNLSGYTLDLQNGRITVGGTIYSISGDVVVVSDGVETDPMELNSEDVITMWGYKERVYGIYVESGHGYLRLQNEDYFVGGWIDVGDKIIRKITEDMLIVVPEGTYSAMVSKNGISATQEITFSRNEEMVWDLGSVDITVQTGQIIFTLTPIDATVMIDGEEIDTSLPVELDYGLHTLRVSADGYDTISQYIKVAQSYATVRVELSPSEDEDEDASSDEEAESVSSDDDDNNDDDDISSDDTSSDDITDDDTTDDDTDDDDYSSSEVASTSSSYRVYIDAPEDVEVYVDGNYVGISPVDFAKVAGSYVVTLRKTGYQTRSYTLQIDDEEKDVNYSFAELLEID